MPDGGKRSDLSFFGRALAAARFLVTGVDTNTWMGPMQPLQPIAQQPDVVGRAWDYPVGFNIQTTPRSSETISFSDLRSLADGWDVLRTIIETRKDQMERLDWSIQLRTLPSGKPSAGRDDPRIKGIEAFFQRPDGEHWWGTWLRMLLEDLFVIDAPTLYRHPDRGGKLFALQVLDGGTIKRVIDQWGRTPPAPNPAYQQILKGIPAVDYTCDELLYLPRNPRIHKAYGYSPVEQIVMTVNTAIRREIWQLQYYTEGNVPEALIGVPDNWNPDQIKQFQTYWDSLLAGNLAARRHAKFVPGGIAKTFIPLKETDQKANFDEWLTRICCFAFSISPQPFQQHMNRATADTAQIAALEEGLAPTKKWVKNIIDLVLATDFNSPDLEFAWEQDTGEDPEKTAQVANTYVRAGIKSLNEVRDEIGLEPIANGDTPMVYVPTGLVNVGVITPGLDGSGALPPVGIDPNQPPKPKPDGEPPETAPPVEPKPKPKGSPPASATGKVEVAQGVVATFHEGGRRFDYPVVGTDRL